MWPWLPERVDVVVHIPCLLTYLLYFSLAPLWDISLQMWDIFP